MNARKLIVIGVVAAAGWINSSAADPTQQTPVGPDVIETITVPELLVPRRNSSDKPAGSVYSLAKAAEVEIAAKKTKLPLNVFGDEPGVASTFVPSGYMGDSGALRIKAAYVSTPIPELTGQSCLEIQSIPKGKQGWAGVYWQTPANNWGKIKGAGYDLREAKTLSFWARGVKGGEKIAEIKIGGLIGAYPDTDSLSVGPLRLTKAWKKYVVDLKDADLRHIAGGFALILRRSDNPRGAAFYLDELRFEGTVSTAPVAVPELAQATQATHAPAVSTATLTKVVKITIPFASAKYAFAQEGREPMDEIAAVAVKYPEARVLVEGHTDNVGPAELNKTLSYQRAKAVGDYLESKGVAHDRITLEGFGEERPIRPDSNSTAEGRLENRRVEVSLLPK